MRGSERVARRCEGRVATRPDLPLRNNSLSNIDPPPHTHTLTSACCDDLPSPWVTGYDSHAHPTGTLSPVHHLPTTIHQGHTPHTRPSYQQTPPLSPLVQWVWIRGSDVTELSGLESDPQPLVSSQALLNGLLVTGHLVQAQAAVLPCTHQELYCGKQFVS